MKVLRVVLFFSLIAVALATASYAFAVGGPPPGLHQEFLQRGERSWTSQRDFPSQASPQEVTTLDGGKTLIRDYNAKHNTNYDDPTILWDDRLLESEGWVKKGKSRFKEDVHERVYVDYVYKLTWYPYYPSEVYHDEEVKWTQEAESYWQWLRTTGLG